MTRFTVVDCDQRSDAWFAERVAILTASVAGDMLAKPLKSGGEPAVRRDLRVRLALEKLTGESGEDKPFVSAAMQRGIDCEAEARGAYEAATGTLVQEVGFIRHNELPIGCSPDGIIGDLDGDFEGLEIKVPKSATHLGYLRHPGQVPSEYLPQITHSLFVTGAPAWTFVSYDSRFPEPLRLFTVRVEAKTLDLAGYEATVRAFLAEVDAELAEVTAMLARAA